MSYRLRSPIFVTFQVRDVFVNNIIQKETVSQVGVQLP